MGAQKLHMLRIEIDSHFRGSAAVPRPWVARLDGPCPRFGMARTFLDALNDWSGADRTCSGRRRGVVACFSLRGGAVYEVSRLRGRSSKRHVAREFCRIEDDGSWTDLELDEALAAADPYPGGAVPHWLPDGSRVSVVHGLGTPTPLGFLLDGDRRRFRLRRDALHEVLAPDGCQRLLRVIGDSVEPISSQEALEWLLHR